MGIINVTPDSFFSDSRAQSIAEALVQAEKHIEEGASFLDIGGQSTRPGALLISKEEELKRVIPIIAALKDNFPESVISVDTFYGMVATEAVAAGAAMINDVSGFEDDEEMFDAICKANVPYILMHKKGRPSTMQFDPVYENIVKEVLDFLGQKIHALSKHGVKDVLIDPGFGFGKTMKDNFLLANEIANFRILEKPILAGVSRKSMIQKTINKDTHTALNGTTAMHMALLERGVSILRVHDVLPAIECIAIYKALHALN